MDRWGIGIFLLGIFLFGILRQANPPWSKIFLFLSGIGLGIVIAAVWAYIIVTNA